jgi:hypothetical protein
MLRVIPSAPCPAKRESNRPLKGGDSAPYVDTKHRCGLRGAVSAVDTGRGRLYPSIRFFG